MRARREDLRNVAIVAHVDHGKTTLVDAMLRQTGSLRRPRGGRRPGHGLDRPRAGEGHHDPRQEHRDPLRRGEDQHRRHARPRRLRRRGRAGAHDGRRRAAARRRGRGPAAADRVSCCARPSRPACPSILVVNKVDRSDARVAEVVHEVEELFLDLDADEHQIDFPIVYCNARTGRASIDADDPDLQMPGDGGGRRPQAAARDAARAHPRARVRHRPPAPGAGHQPRRVALRRPARAVPRPARHAAQAASRWRGAAPTAPSRTSGSPSSTVTEALDRVDADEAGPGEIMRHRRARRRDHRRDARRPDDPRPLPVIHIDDPSLSMTIGINTSPLSGQDGQQADRPPGEVAPRHRARRQRVAAGAADGAARRVGGPGPRRAPARGARGDDAARGLRAHRRQARGRHPRDRRQAPRAGRAGGHRRSRGAPRRRSRSCLRCARAAWSRW